MEENSQDPFVNCEPVKGLEHLGAHIRSADGSVSGSPANFKNLRGKTDPSLEVKTVSQEEIAAVEAELIKQLG